MVQVPQFVLAPYGPKRQRQLDLGQIAEVVGRAAIARRADATGRVVGTQAGGDHRCLHTAQHVELVRQQCSVSARARPCPRGIASSPRRSPPGSDVVVTGWLRRPVDSGSRGSCRPRHPRWRSRGPQRYPQRRRRSRRRGVSPLATSVDTEAPTVLSRAPASVPDRPRASVVVLPTIPALAG